MTISPSTQWQHWILIVALAWLLLETWRGWRLGLIRGAIRFMTLVASWLGASAAAAMTSATLSIFFHTPPSFLPTIAATLVGLGIYTFSAFVSGLLFKRTTHHHGIIRWILGFGGAICGFLFGLFLLWGAISLVRSLGVLGEMRLMEAKQRGVPPSSDHLACNLVKLGKSLEVGSMGHFLIEADPLSATFYDNTRKVMTVVNDHEALMRFIMAPNTQQLLQNPHIMALLQDPEVQQALKEHNIIPLFENKNIRDVFHDPELLQELKSFDLTATLNNALKKPAPAALAVPVVEEASRSTFTEDSSNEQIPEN